MREPVRVTRHFVVVVRVALVQEAEHVFIDEVEVEEPVHIAQGGMVAHWVSLVGVGESAQNVPRRCDEQEEQRSCERLEHSPATPLAG